MRTLSLLKHKKQSKKDFSKLVNYQTLKSLISNDTFYEYDDFFLTMPKKEQRFQLRKNLIDFNNIIEKNEVSFFQLSKFTNFAVIKKYNVLIFNIRIKERFSKFLIINKKDLIYA